MHFILPHALMPLEEFSWHFLLHRGADLTRKFLGASSGGGVLCIDVVQAEDGGVVSTFGVILCPRKLSVVGFHRRHEYQMDSRAGHGGVKFHSGLRIKANPCTQRCQRYVEKVNKSSISSY